MACSQEMVATSSKPLGGGANIPSAGVYVNGAELFENTRQTFDVRLTERVHNVEIEGRDGRTIEHSSDAADHDEGHIPLDQRCQ